MIQKTLDYIRIPKKIFWGLLGLIFIIALGVALKPQSYEVDSGKIQTILFQNFVIDEGVSRYQNRKVFSAPMDGVVPDHKLQAGDPFKKNQIIMKFLWDRDVPLVAPYDGVILKIFEKDKKSVLRGAPIFEFGSPDTIEIKAPLLTEEVIHIQLNQKAIISKWGGSSDLNAKVIRIEPSAKEEVSALGVKEQRVDVYLTPEGDTSSWTQIGDGFRVEVKILKTEKPQTKVVPIGALFRKDNKIAIYTIDSHMRTHLQYIEVGERNRDVAELLTPLEDGQRIVLYPSSQIQDQVKVKIRKEL